MSRRGSVASAGKPISKDIAAHKARIRAISPNATSRLRPTAASPATELSGNETIVNIHLSEIETIRYSVNITLLSMVEVVASSWVHVLGQTEEFIGLGSLLRSAAHCASAAAEPSRASMPCAPQPGRRHLWCSWLVKAGSLVEFHHPLRPPVCFASCKKKAHAFMQESGQLFFECLELLTHQGSHKHRKQNEIHEHLRGSEFSLTAEWSLW
jgi:hypothetical protein